jgi:prevent-host-death family protein
MKRSENKEVSAFDAKTHLSSLIRNVEEGSSYTITRRGKPVARLEPVGKSRQQAIQELVEGFRAVRRHAKGSGDIRSLIEEGRKY